MGRWVCIWSYFKIFRNFSFSLLSVFIKLYWERELRGKNWPINKIKKKMCRWQKTISVIFLVFITVPVGGKKFFFNPNQLNQLSLVWETKLHNFKFLCQSKKNSHLQQTKPCCFWDVCCCLELWRIQHNKNHASYGNLAVRNTRLWKADSDVSLKPNNKSLPSLKIPFLKKKINHEDMRLLIVL